MRKCCSVVRTYTQIWTDLSSFPRQLRVFLLTCDPLSFTNELFFKFTWRSWSIYAWHCFCCCAVQAGAHQLTLSPYPISCLVHQLMFTQRTVRSPAIVNSKVLSCAQTADAIYVIRQNMTNGPTHGWWIILVEPYWAAYLERCPQPKQIVYPYFWMLIYLEVLPCEVMRCTAHGLFLFLIFIKDLANQLAIIYLFCANDVKLISWRAQ